MGADPMEAPGLLTALRRRHEAEVAGLVHTWRQRELPVPPELTAAVAQDPVWRRHLALFDAPRPGAAPVPLDQWKGHSLGVGDDALARGRAGGFRVTLEEATTTVVVDGAEWTCGIVVDGFTPDNPAELGEIILRGPVDPDAAPPVAWERALTVARHMAGEIEALPEPPVRLSDVPRTDGPGEAWALRVDHPEGTMVRVVSAPNVPGELDFLAAAGLDVTERTRVGAVLRRAAGVSPLALAQAGVIEAFEELQSRLLVSPSWAVHRVREVADAVAAVDVAEVAPLHEDAARMFAEAGYDVRAGKQWAAARRAARGYGLAVDPSAHRDLVSEVAALGVLTAPALLDELMALRTGDLDPQRAHDLALGWARDALPHMRRLSPDLVHALRAAATRADRDPEAMDALVWQEARQSRFFPGNTVGTLRVLAGQVRGDVDKHAEMARYWTLHGVRWSRELLAAGVIDSLAVEERLEWINREIVRGRGYRQVAEFGVPLSELLDAGVFADLRWLELPAMAALSRLGMDFQSPQLNRWVNVTIQFADEQPDAGDIRTLAADESAMRLIADTINIEELPRIDDPAVRRLLLRALLEHALGRVRRSPVFATWEWAYRRLLGVVDVEVATRAHPTVMRELSAVLAADLLAATLRVGLSAELTVAAADEDFERVLSAGLADITALSKENLDKGRNVIGSSIPYVDITGDGRAEISRGPFDVDRPGMTDREVTVERPGGGEFRYGPTGLLARDSGDWLPVAPSLTYVATPWAGDRYPASVAAWARARDQSASRRLRHLTPDVAGRLLGALSGRDFPQERGAYRWQTRGWERTRREYRNYAWSVRPGSLALRTAAEVLGVSADAPGVRPLLVAVVQMALECGWLGLEYAQLRSRVEAIDVPVDAAGVDKSVAALARMIVRRTWPPVTGEEWLAIASYLATGIAPDTGLSRHNWAMEPLKEYAVFFSDPDAVSAFITADGQNPERAQAARDTWRVLIESGLLDRPCLIQVLSVNKYGSGKGQWFTPEMREGLSQTPARGLLTMDEGGTVRVIDGRMADAPAGSAIILGNDVGGHNLHISAVIPLGLTPDRAVVLPSYVFGQPLRTVVSAEELEALPQRWPTREELWQAAHAPARRPIPGDRRVAELEMRTGLGAEFARRLIHEPPWMSETLKFYQVRPGEEERDLAAQAWDWLSPVERQRLVVACARDDLRTAVGVVTGHFAPPRPVAPAAVLRDLGPNPGSEMAYYFRARRADAKRAEPFLLSYYLGMVPRLQIADPRTPESARFIAAQLGLHLKGIVDDPERWERLRSPYRELPSYLASGALGELEQVLQEGRTTLAQVKPGEAGLTAEAPLLVVPDVVADVEKQLGLSRDAAAYFLQIAALHTPRDRRIAESTGWEPTRIRKAAQECVAAGVLYAGTRPTSGRAVFLPGAWREESHQVPGMEAVKVPVDPVARWLLHPKEPMDVVFTRTWERIRTGGIPRR